MKVRIDRNLCTGLGNCVALAPDVFELDEEGKAVVLDPASVDDETLLEAAESCPYDAIIVEDDEGNQVYPWTQGNFVAK
jgi:ferredoxin